MKRRRERKGGERERKKRETDNIGEKAGHEGKKRERYTVVKREKRER